MKRGELDDWFPTVVRYCGVALMVVLAGTAVFGHLEYPSLIIAATGMILFKSVRDAANGKPNGRPDGDTT